MSEAEGARIVALSDASAALPTIGDQVALFCRPGLAGPLLFFGPTADHL